MLKLEDWPFTNLMTKESLKQYSAQSVLEKLLNDDYNFVPFKNPKGEYAQELIYGLYINNSNDEIKDHTNMLRYILPLGGLQTSLISGKYTFDKHSYPMYFVDPRYNYELETIAFKEIKEVFGFEPKALDTNSITEFKEYMVGLFISIYERKIYSNN